ncbi:hypothetical protein N0V90_008742 [Kalmusia sp. IMI 367209]|nr:hypothetical protein N0V90_008742 [Kalmusia sp. IMI 367209]
MTLPDSNIAWVVPENSTSTSHLTKKNLAVPTPGHNQVLIRLTAASLNFREVLIALNEILGGFERDGTLQHWIVEDDERVIKAPRNLTAAESASLKTAGVTAWSAIRESLDGKFNGELQPWVGDWRSKRLAGKTVLTQGTGGIAAALGATVIATSSSDSKLAFAKSLGATHLINYTSTPDWDKEALRLTDGKGVDHVIEVAGAKTLLKSINSTRPGGLISLIGILSEAEDLPKELVPSVLYSGRIIKGCCAFTRDATAELARFVEEHNIKPVIAKEFDFEDTLEAFEAIQKQNAVGKFLSVQTYGTHRNYPITSVIPSYASVVTKIRDAKEEGGEIKMCGEAGDTEAVGYAFDMGYFV